MIKTTDGTDAFEKPSFHISFFNFTTVKYSLKYFEQNTMKNKNVQRACWAYAKSITINQHIYDLTSSDFAELFVSFEQHVVSPTI